MNFFKNIWHTYKAVITKNCTDDFVAETSLAYWQNRLFAASVVYLIPLSTMALIPGIYLAYITNLEGLIFTDVLAVIIVLSVAFLPGISVHTRKLLFNGVLYLTSFALLIYLGSFGPGLLYLLGISIFIILSLEKKYGYIAVALNTVICTAIAIFLYFNVGNFAVLNQYGLDSWIAVSTNLIFLSAVAVLLIPILFEGLQSAIIEENNLRTELELEEGRLKETVQELNRKNKELEDFSYTISHDLKEPLRMIRNFMELLDRRYGTQLDEKAKSYIYYATDGATRMEKSIDDLMEYSRVGRLYKDFQKVDTEKLVREVLSYIHVEELHPEARITIGDLPTLKVVPVSFKMLLQNLIVNGLKYQPKGQQPEIMISAEEKENHWLFSVKDNGIGIKAEYTDQIFGMFKRLHTREQYPGNGMGLAICKKIAEQHGGEIWVESVPDKGSVFNFTIQKIDHA